MKTLTGARIGGWVFALIFFIAYLVFAFFAPPAQQFTHTFLLVFSPQTQPGVLTSQRFSFDFWIVAFYAVLPFIPFTLLFALNDTKGTRSNDGQRVWLVWQLVHIIFVVVWLIWMAATLVWLSINWAHANVSESSNYYNPANDIRWCCVYYNLPGAPCYNALYPSGQQACNPGVGAPQLTLNNVFLYQFAFHIIFTVLMIVDLILMATLIYPSYRKHIQEKTPNEPTEAANLEAALLPKRRLYRGKKQ